jgi:hypothetical protein
MLDSKIERGMVETGEEGIILSQMMEFCTRIVHRQIY